MIFAIKPFEIHDGDGIRTTVFFKGCPLRCKWCHNPESFTVKKEILFDKALCKNCLRCVALCSANSEQSGKHAFEREKCTVCGKCEEICPAGCYEVAGKDMSAEEIASEVIKDEVFMKKSGGGVTFSGGEPLMQVDLCVEIAKLLKQYEINIAIDTSVYASKDAIDKIIPYTDKFLIDIKAIDENVHKECTGVSNKLILENIKYIDSLGKSMEIRYPYVPGFNDGEAEKISEFVKRLKNVTKVVVLAYHNYAASKYKALGMNNTLPSVLPLKSEIQKVQKLFQ
jgi:pyruvate formate lyase activating enzyme